jgi:hypothetical protein
LPIDVFRWWWRARIWRRGKIKLLGSGATDPTDKLDIDRTALATAGQPGLFQPVFADRSRQRSNVVLLEQASAYDHLTNLFALAANRLRQEDITVELFGFGGSIELLFPERDPPCRFEDLPNDSRRDRLIIIGSGVGIVDRLTGGLARSAKERLSEWPYKYLLSTKAVREWGEVELEFMRAGFALGTATPRGLVALARAAESKVERPFLLDVRLNRVVSKPAAMSDVEIPEKSTENATPEVSANATGSKDAEKVNLTYRERLAFGAVHLPFGSDVGAMAIYSPLTATSEQLGYSVPLAGALILVGGLLSIFWQMFRRG